MEQFRKKIVTVERSIPEAVCCRELLETAFLGLNSGAQHLEKFLDHLERTR